MEQAARKSIHSSEFPPSSTVPPARRLGPTRLRSGARRELSRVHVKVMSRYSESDDPSTGSDAQHRERRARRRARPTRRGRKTHETRRKDPLGRPVGTHDSMRKLPSWDESFGELDGAREGEGKSSAGESATFLGTKVRVRRYEAESTTDEARIHVLTSNLRCSGGSAAHARKIFLEQARGLVVYVREELSYESEKRVRA